MISFRKAILFCQIHLTAIMTLAAGMPQVACACSSDPTWAPAISQLPVQMSECCCCGSCSPISRESNPSGRPGNRSCCNSDARSDKAKPSTSSLQMRGKGCTKTAVLPRIIGVFPPKTPKPDASGNWVAFLPTQMPSIQIGSQFSAQQWTGHSPAPPGDLITSLQRLLI